MIVRFSKYDFWTPEQILDFKKCVPEKKYFVLRWKIFFGKVTKTYFSDFFWKVNIFKMFHWKSIENFREKSGKIENFPDFSGFFSNFFYWFSMKNFENFDFSKMFRKICFRYFSEKYFSSQEKIFFSGTNFLKSKICSGIQKSYLENHTIIIKSFKLKNPVF